MTRDKLEERITRWRKKWVDSENSARGARLRIGKEVKETKGEILTEVFKAGFSRQPFRLLMLQMDHEDHRRGVYERIKETEDRDLIGEFAQLVLAADTHGLPLFDAAEVKELEAAAKEAEEHDNVTNIKAA
jgi:tRNA A37 N6-isopentenylltransferase MiaA